MSRRVGLLPSLLMLLLLPLSTAVSGAESDAVEMIAWEQQNWEANGGFERLTLWADGRSEVLVVPLQTLVSGQDRYRAKPGWEMVAMSRRIEFVRRGIYPPETAQEKIRAALAAGIEQLETFRPGYVDGGGTRVVIQRGGRQREVIIPYFSDRERGSLNHRRFQTVAAILGRFERDAYEVPPRP